MTSEKTARVRKPSNRGRAAETAYQAVCLAVCLIIAILCLYPLLYCIVVSFCEPKYVNFDYILPVPTRVTLFAYRQVLTVGGFLGKALGVSVFRTAVGTVLSVVLCAMLAYALSRRALPGRRYFMYLLIFIILFNGGLIPTYLVMREVGLLDNIWVYIFPNLINAWNVIIIKQSMEGIPREVEESAEIDGVNDVQNFVQIILPMSKPVLAAMAIFTLVWQWNSWYDAMIYVSPAHSELWPLQYYTSISLNNLNQIKQNSIGDLTSLMGVANLDSMSIKMALTVITTLPILVVYPFFQKYFTKGVYLGAVKG